ncbi:MULTISPECIES: hypothetical protein [unclassified Colwellia]|uniref:hypothetical protein n=1 Tax=unclassified Colwellia TaxID=196834 RepID=UPI0015F7072C|nr:MULTISPECIES: hypothetical protein [unclassified Colwellia]MBA6233812.1 hypothetical protein [Colwellia sp. MB02u-7]MBA6237372.1 hypothetical protein [Colwellia sp. MB02u-11]MBA6300372.1 hypothetical protein [Colwellia sp. MB3u-22]MBA6310963.1 hypothetical protein [Colwellia sp. MB3u-64]
MKSRKIHKIIGLILVLPMLGWTLTGLIFFIKPGYSEAYEQLSLKTYPLEKSLLVSAPDWQEAKLINTILGHHLLVKTKGKVEHLDPVSLLPKKFPTQLQYKALLEDAFLNHKERYGKIIKINGDHALTSTGVEIKLNWDRLTLNQKGNDTRLINLLYKIHYLQWTPFNGFNQLVGILGLFLLFTLTLFGVRIYITSRK